MQHEVNNPAPPRKRGKFYIAIVVVLIAMFTIPLGYNKTSYELLHAYQRYERRKSKMEKYHVRDTIPTFKKFLEVELNSMNQYQRMQDSAREAETRK